VAYLVDRYHEADDVTLDELMQFVHGPDFPTGGMILGDEGIRQAYATGRGRVVMRSQVHPEELSGGRMALIVTELPYQVNKSTLVGRIATLAREGRVEGIGDLRDESDRMGIRVVIELKRGVEWEPVLAGLLKYSQLQATFGVNMLALVDGEPRTLSLKRALLHYIDHRYNVVERRSRYELERARQRAHVLEGLLIALDHLDEVIDTIRRSQNADTAKTNLCKQFRFTEPQALAILDLQLRRLAALERRRVQEEYRDVMARIAALEDLLSSEAKIRGVVKEEILDLKRVYGDARRTRVSDLEVSTSVSAGDLVADASLVLAISFDGAARQFPASMAHGGSGGLVRQLLDTGVAVHSLARANAQEKVAFFTNKGRAFAFGAHQIPDARQVPDGAPLQSLAQLDEGEVVVSLIPLGAVDEAKSVMLATAEGRVKRVSSGDINSVNRDSMTAIGLVGQDEVVGAAMVTEGVDILCISRQGRAIRFPADDVPLQGLPARGVKGMDLKDGDLVMGLNVAVKGAELLLVTANGFAKRVKLDEYSAQGRGGQGTATVDARKSETAGPIASACVVDNDDRVLLGTAQGVVEEKPVSGIRMLARDSWGTLVTRTRSQATVSLDMGDQVVACVVVPFSLDEGPEPSSGAPGDGGDAGGSPAPGSRPRTRRRTAPKASAEQEAEPKSPSRRRSGKSAESSAPRTTKKASASGAPAEDVAVKPARSRRSATAASEAARQKAEAPARKGRATQAKGSPAATAEKASGTATDGEGTAAPRKAARTRRAAATPAPERLATGSEVPKKATRRPKPKVDTPASDGVAPARRSRARTPSSTPAETEAQPPASERRRSTATGRGSGRSAGTSAPPTEAADGDQKAPAARPPTRVVRSSPQRRRKEE